MGPEAGAAAAGAAQAAAAGAASGMTAPVTLVAVLIGLSLAPFAAMMVTSYVKLVVVLSLVRQALGVQQIPPSIVLNGLAVILSVYIMAPVAEASFNAAQKAEAKPNDLASIRRAAEAAAVPLKEFLAKHANKRERAFFQQAAKKLWPADKAATLKDDDLLVLIPAFTVGELSSAFQIGFLLYLPFIVIDLIVSNVLLAQGMMMVSPMTISLPLKLLLFVMANGWTRLIHGLVMQYGQHGPVVATVGAAAGAAGS